MFQFCRTRSLNDPTTTPVSPFVIACGVAAASLSVCAMFWANPGDALAQASGAAAAAPTGQTYAVKPGQSLNDVVSELTGSKDRDVRAKAARALFDANPNAFGNHDINKLKLGAVFNVPADLIGSAASSAASAPEAQPNPPAETPAPAQASESASARRLLPRLRRRSNRRRAPRRRRSSRRPRPHRLPSRPRASPPWRRPRLPAAAEGAATAWQRRRSAFRHSSSPP